MVFIGKGIAASEVYVEDVFLCHLRSICRGIVDMSY